MKLKLSIEEQNELLEKITCKYNEKVALNFNKKGILSYIKKYEMVVTSVETETYVDGRGNLRQGADFKRYFGVSYEYINDLKSREFIEFILDNVNIVERKRLLDVIKPKDDILRKKIRGNEFILNERVIHKYPKAKYWWYYGLPDCIDP